MCVFPVVYLDKTSYSSVRKVCRNYKIFSGNLCRVGRQKERSLEVPCNNSKRVFGESFEKLANIQTTLVGFCTCAVRSSQSAQMLTPQQPVTRTGYLQALYNPGTDSVTEGRTPPPQKKSYVMYVSRL